MFSGIKLGFLSCVLLSGSSVLMAGEPEPSKPNQGSLPDFQGQLLSPEMNQEPKAPPKDTAEGEKAPDQAVESAVGPGKQAQQLESTSAAQQTQAFQK